MNNKTYTCIICPNGCDIAVTYDSENIRCEGNLCPKGEEYVRRELTAPQRTISSSVTVWNGELPLASVRLSAPVPKEKIFDVMKEIRNLRIEAPVTAGTVLIKNILGYDSDLIVTRSVARKAENYE